MEKGVGREFRYETWEVDYDLIQSEDYKLNNRIALEVSKKGFDEISKKYTHICLESIKAILALIPNSVNRLQGAGIDLGGGVGSVSSAVAGSQSVEEIICLEVTENCVKHCHEIVISSILGKSSYKVRSVIGDFNKIKLKNSVLDFAIAWDAMHHSLDVVDTLKEVKRVLKDDGCLLIIDRAHDNSILDEEIERMLNIQYSKEFMIDNFLPEGKVLMRRQNGEHEYRFDQWNEFFEQAGFYIDQSILVMENHDRNVEYINDAGINQVTVDFELGGFERRKVIYMLKAL
jgi:ubiquinone/menaquinone biosynthesis C-methylase UbiE